MDRSEREPLAGRAQATPTAQRHVLSFAAPNDREKAAGMVNRSCTDVFCTAFLVAGLMALGWIVNYAKQHGDIRRVYHGVDWRNQVCGVDPEVVDKPILYWCTKGNKTMDDNAVKLAKMLPWSDGKDVAAISLYSIISASSRLDLKNPICVSTCPNSSQTFNPCFQTVTSEEENPKDITGTFWRNFTYHFSFVQDHPSISVGGRYCLPEDTDLITPGMSLFHTARDRTFFYLSQLQAAKDVLVAAFVMAFVFGYIYIFLVRKFACCVVYLLLSLAALLPIAAGVLFLYGAFAVDASDQLAAHFGMQNVTVPVVPTTQNKSWDITIGVTLCVVGLLVAVAGCCLKHSIDVVIAILDCTTSVLFDMPTLLLHPLLSSVSKGLVAVFGTIGLAWIVSVGSVQQAELSHYLPAGLVRKFSFSTDEYLYLFGYSFVSMWIYELLCALCQFSLAYSTQLWFHAEIVDGKKQTPFLPEFRACVVGLTFHLGSLAFGACLMTIFKILYLVLALVERQTNNALSKKEETKDLNQVVKGMEVCCCCCLNCLENILRYLNKNTYVIIACDSTNFCSSAHTAFVIFAEEFAALGGLNGATIILQILGMIVISGSTTFLTWLSCQHISAFKDPASEKFIAHPEIVSVAGCLLGILVSGSFMTVFDSVSDNMIFTWACDKRYRAEKGLGPNPNVPAALKALMEKSGS